MTDMRVRRVNKSSSFTPYEAIEKKEEDIVSSMVKKYIEDNNTELHCQLLEQLGLFEYEKEYAPLDTVYSKEIKMEYPESELVDGVLRFYKVTNKIYPKITNEEYQQLLTIAEKTKHLTNENTPQITSKVYQINARNTNGDNFSVNFMWIIAAILWIGGLFLSLMMSETQVEVIRAYGGKTTETVHNWVAFFTYFSIYGSIGALCMCLAKLFENIQVIANGIKGFCITETNEDTEEKK